MGSINTAGLNIVKAALRDFMDDDAMTLAAALAFYAALSVAPLVLILLWAGAFLPEGANERITAQAEQFAGPAAAEAVAVVITNAQQRPDLRTITGIISIGAAILAATGVFAQLQYSMNRVWDVAGQSGGALSWIKKRLLSLLMILIMGALLIASLALGALLSAAAEAGSTVLPGKTPLLPMLNALVSVVIFTGFFAAIYKVLPDVRINWKATWGGAVFTAILFTVGRYAVELYLAHSSTGSAYGAAGSLLVLLVWIYYSSLIFFFGAEITQVWARRRGLAFAPPKRRSALA